LSGASAPFKVLKSTAEFGKYLSKITIPMAWVIIGILLSSPPSTFVLSSPVRLAIPDLVTSMPSRRMPSIEVSRVFLVLGLMAAKSLKGLRVAGLLRGSLLGCPSLTGFVDSRYVCSRTIIVKIQLLTQFAYSLVRTLHKFVGSFCLRSLAVRSAETFEFESDRTEIIVGLWYVTRKLSSKNLRFLAPFKNLCLAALGKVFPA
jgi:hypothetical protein